MQREIKFRAWDKLSLEMKNVRQIHYDYKEVLFNDIGDMTDWKTFEDCILMQYTGLKDKKGKEIYEGDVVKRMKVCYDWEKKDGEERYEVEEISFIEYRDNGFWIKDESFGWEGESLWDWDEMEVIGNIYENEY
jgi:uncharacterized phage protein (TIGR01671 family)